MYDVPGRFHQQQQEDSDAVAELLRAQHAHDPPPPPPDPDPGGYQRRHQAYIDRLPDWFKRLHGPRECRPVKIDPRARAEAARFLKKQLRQAPYFQERDPVPREQAEHRSWFVELIARRLQNACMRGGSVAIRAWRVVHLLFACASGRNLWLGRGLDRADGELFDGTGNLWTCNRILCETCQANKRRRSRKRAYAAIDGLSQQPGYNVEKWKFLTLGFTRLKGVSVEEAIKLHNECFKAFRNRPLYRAEVQAGIKGVEFTPPIPQKPGYNVHSHHLIYSNWLDLYQIKREWTASVEVVLAKAGLLHLLTYYDSYQCTLGEACSHPAHGTAPVGQLELPYGHKVCETHPDCAIDPDGRHVCRAHVNCTIDTEGKHGVPHGQLWVGIKMVRPKLKTETQSQISIADAVNECCKYITKSTDWEKLPDEDLIAIALVKRWPRMFEVLGDCYGKAASCNSSASPQAARSELDTPRLTDSEDPGKKTGQGRAPPLLSYPDDFPMERWLQILAYRVSKAQTLRAYGLAIEYPSAEFETLDGRKWNLGTCLEQKRVAENRRLLNRAEAQERRQAAEAAAAHCPFCAGRLYQSRCIPCGIQIAVNL